MHTAGVMLMQSTNTAVFGSRLSTRIASVNPPQALWPLAVVATGYYLGCLAGFALRFPSSGISFFWPPTAVLTAALLMSAPASWTALLGAAFLAHVIAHAQVHVSPAVSPLLFFGNASQALLAAAIVRRYLRPAALFANLRNVATFLIGACTLAPALASIIPAYVYVSLGWAPDFFQAWRDRAISNAISMLTLVPSFMTLWDVLAERRRAGAVRVVEYALVLLGMMAVQLVTARIGGLDILGLSVALYAPAPFLIWATVRFGGPGLSFALAWTTLLTIDAASPNHGSLRGLTPADTVVGVQLLIAAYAIPMMLIAGLLEQNRTEHATLVDVERQSRAILRALPDSLYFLTRRAADLTSTDNNDISTVRDARTGEVVSSELAECVSRMSRVESPNAPSIADLTCTTGGDVRYYEARFVAIDDQRLLSVVRDTTEQKESARALAEANDALVRTGRIVAIAEFSASIAHELQQPLAAIAMNAKVCLRSLQAVGASADVREALDDVVKDSVRAAEIVNRTREMFTNHPTRKTAMNLNGAVRHIVEIAAGRLRQSEVRIELGLDDRLPPVLADAVQVHQVLLNLIVNAMDAMSDSPREGRGLRITSRRGRDVAIVSVRDRGHGFEPEEARRLFDAFYTTKTSGIGMGLAISRSIVTNHGGKLWAVSNVDGGATFRFTLPLMAPGRASD